ncbi:G-protein alpha subunit [Pluteus cervinus]|uniref:G-protein alpha subunit n=1 Tax=Pluteus cervinus TaxID=181527 RepID=A0ACD3AQG2_9AGAR|nr:G-protein alpha subunit [Pluteus cervinus]
MGSCASTGATYARLAGSDALYECNERQELKRETKVLLLGSSDSGKSTVFKQMQIVYQGGFSPTELAKWTPVVRENVIECARVVVMVMRKKKIEYEEYSNQVLAEKILAPQPSLSLTPEMAVAIHRIWKDPATSKMINECWTDIGLMDSAFYFFQEVLRIGSPDYIPNEADVLRARQQSKGVTDAHFLMKTISMHMFDVGGQRSERTQWMHCFNHVTLIIFCIALSEYNQVLLEDQSQNRMRESLSLFEAVINSRWFLRTGVILFLNKIDVFKAKLPKVPLEEFFPEYIGGPDINNGIKFVLWRFSLANRARLNVYPHLTEATNTMNIRNVFKGVEDMILQNGLAASGLL